MYYPQPGPPRQSAIAPQNGCGTAGFVLGLSAVVFAWIPIIGIVGWPLSILGLIFSIIGMLKSDRGLATNRGLAIAGTVLSVLALLVCIIWVAGIAANVHATTPTASAGAPQPGAAAAPGGVAPAVSSNIAAFGQKLTYPSGLAVQVSAPEVFHPSSSAAGATGPRAFAVTVTVTNGTADQYSFNSFEWSPRATHAGREASEIFDSELSTPTRTTLLAGKSITYKVGFSIGGEQGDLQVEFSPLGQQPAIFTGTY